MVASKSEHEVELPARSPQADDGLDGSARLRSDSAPLIAPHPADLVSLPSKRRGVRHTEPADLARLAKHATTNSQLWIPTLAPGPRARRLSQVGFLLLWVALFVTTAKGTARLIPADLFLQTDPLVAILTMGATRIIAPWMVSSLSLVLLTVLFGRFFCGWICPLGTLIDLAGYVWPAPFDRFSAETHARMQNWKYYLLAAMLVASLFSVQSVLWLDPLVVIFRGVAAGLWPAGFSIVASAAPGIGESFSATSSKLTITVLPALLLVVAVGLVAITPRFYCRYICPLGAFYGLLSRFAVLRRRVHGCNGCVDIAENQGHGMAKRGTGTGTGATDKQTRLCVDHCRMGALPKGPQRSQNHECIRCMTGKSNCGVEAIDFEWVWPPTQQQTRKIDAPLQLERRHFIVSTVAGGVGLIPLVSLAGAQHEEPGAIIRPPRVVEEETFLQACIRCSMCVKACPTGTLQPLFLQAGVGGLWSPALAPRIGGCQAECNACGSVCPTGAIPRFTTVEADKWGVKMGTAVLEKGRCISHSGDKKCMKCVEACPTKAIDITLASGAFPTRPVNVQYERCTGCGECELACRKIVFGTPAITVNGYGRGQLTSLGSEPTASYTVRVVDS